MKTVQRHYRSIVCSVLLGLTALASITVSCTRDQRAEKQRAHSAATEPLTLPAGFVNEGLGGTWNGAVGLTIAEDGQIYVWEKGGKVWRLDPNGTRFPTPVLDLTEEVGNWRDHGLLGFTLHPNFLNNGYIYAFYIVDFHHLTKFGTPQYSSTTDEYHRPTTGRVTRYRVDFTTGVVDPTSRTVLFGKTASDGCPVTHESHGLGTLMIGTDGTLLLTCGDGASYAGVDSGGTLQMPGAIADGIVRPEEDVGAFRSQMLDSAAGKILRIDASTGDGVPSNPHFDPAKPRSARSRVWALGFRNPFRVSLKPDTGSHDPADGQPGTIYVADVGWDLKEELDVVDSPGKNYGWPLFEGFTFSDYVNSPKGNRTAPNPLYGSGNCTQQYFTFQELIKQETLNQLSFPNSCDTSQQIPAQTYMHKRPVIVWDHYVDGTSVGIFGPSGNANSVSIDAPNSPVIGTPFNGTCAIGGTWYGADAFPSEFKDTYFAADCTAGWIKAFVFDDANKLLEVRPFAPANTAFAVSLAVGPLDGNLYFVEYGERVRRIKYIGTGNAPPTAVASSSVNYGPNPLQVSFTGSGSTDPELGQLQYQWDFGDGSPVSTDANPVHTFDSGSAAPQAYEVVLTVTDHGGASNSTSLVVVVNDTPPNALITSPVSGSLFTSPDNESVSFEADVSDAEQSTTELTCTWQVILHHNTHTHPESAVQGCSQSAVLSPLPCSDETYYYRVALRVDDGEGLSTETSSFVYPDCVPEHFSPGAGEVVTAQPSFSWKPVLGADSYELRVTDSLGQVTTQVFDEVPLNCANDTNPCMASPGFVLATGVAQFQVRAHNPVEGWRGWSETTQFFADSCGDGVVDGGEECDDGNGVDTDGCSNTCQQSSCNDGSQNQGETGIDCGGPCSACPMCGDGIVQGTEQCDDGNAVDDDSCSNACATATCQDGQQNQGEDGPDCGGPCIDCGAVCVDERLSAIAATASSSGANLGAPLSIDGNLGTRWSSVYADPQWLAVDLGAPKRVLRVVLRWEFAASADYDIQVSDSLSGPWATIHTDAAGNGGIDDITLNGVGRYVRMYSRSRTSTWGNSLWEFEVYGDERPNCGSEPLCPNGTLDAGEECDDGNTNDDDACSNACVAATCSDSSQNQGETGVDCGGPCTACPACGDAQLDPAEQCDDGNDVDDDSCSNDCVAATCSDSVQNQGEAGVDCGGPCAECDDECFVERLTATSATASTVEGTNFQASLAIDGNAATRWSSLYADPQWLSVDLGAARWVTRVVLRWEVAASRNYDIQVADSASGPWTAVHTDATGNGGVDDIADLNTQARFVRMYSRARATNWGNSLWELEVYGAVDAQCEQPALCPNGVVDAGEECDDGNTVDTDTCTNSCLLASCDDAVQNQGEAGVDCGGPCLACPACGDGQVDFGEECDDGNTVDDDACSNDCYFATCDDAVQNQGEAGVDCGGPCLACPACGDGQVDFGEECDDGNIVDTDTCTNSCLLASCDDAVQNQGEAGVDCGGPCLACPACGDGQVDFGEECDDGNTVDDDACSNACIAATCADAILNQGESDIDCGGPCPSCGVECVVERLTPTGAAASSIEGANHAAALAIDGSIATRWSSSYSDPQWLRVDLGAPRRITRVVLRWEVASSRDYDIQVAESESGPWTTIYTDAAGNGGNDDISGLNTVARFVRMYSRARATNWGNSLWEFEVYGASDPQCQQPSACPNGQLDSGEECDDGNFVGDDACSNNCVASTCNDAVQNQGETGTDCGGPCPACPSDCVELPLATVAATASSISNNNLLASYAIDGNANTRWSSLYADPQWLQVDLGQARHVGRVILSWEFAHSSNYDIQVADTPSGPWTNLFSTETGNGGIDDLSNLSGTGRYVRMYSRSRATTWGNSLWEFEVHGDPDPSCAQ